MAKETLINVRCSFPEVFEPTEYRGKTAYRIKYLLPKGSDVLKQVQDKLLEAAIEKAGDVVKAKKLLAAFEGIAQQNCLMDGDKKETAGFAGHMILTAVRSEESGPPIVVDRLKDANGDWVRLKASDAKIYSGCYVNSTVDLYLTGGENPGARCSLVNVQFYKHGESLGGAGPASTEGLDDLTFEDDDDDNLI